MRMHMPLSSKVTPGPLIPGRSSSISSPASAPPACVWLHSGGLPSHPRRIHHQRRTPVPVQCNSTGLSGDGSISLSQLQQALAEAVAREDYPAAARFRDDLQQLQRVSTLAVEDANAKFYKAFQDSDAEVRPRPTQAMGEIWGHGEHVQCTHPMAGCIAGREEVMESWSVVLQSVNFDVMIKDVRVHATEMMGFVTCVEVMEGEDNRGRLIATNIFEKQDGTWKIVHHHASPGPRPGRA